MGILETFFSSIVSGGITGILGVVVQRIADYKNRKLDLQAAREKSSHEVQMREMDAKIMEQEWTARTKISEVETAGQVDVVDAEAFAKSFSEPQRYSEKVRYTRGQGWMMVLLDFFRGLIRPALTVYLCVVTTLVYRETRELLNATGGVPISPEQAIDLLRLITGTILYLSTTCVLWWFGTRNKQTAPKIS